MARERTARKPDEKATNEGTPLLDRRSYLGLAGAAVATVGGIGTAGTAAAAERVNVVDEGADDTGGTPVNDVLNRVHGDDVEVYFPPGEYRLDPISLEASNWSLVGDDATLVVPGSVQSRYLYLGGSDWTVDGFTVDLSADGAAPVNYLRGSDWAFKNVEFVGQMDDPQNRGESALLYPAVESSDGTGLLENVVAMDGCANPDESSNRGLTWLGQNNEGKMTWRGCEFALWANNTLYAANSAGPVVIEDCLFQNTNVGVRIGGETTVRNCVWKQTGRVPAQRWTGARAARGLWINSNQYTAGDIVVEGCEFDMTGPDATTAINASNDLDGITVRNTRIRQGNGQEAITLPGGGPTTLRKVSITGESETYAVELSGRDGSTLENVCIQQPGDGVRITDASGCEVVDSTVNVSGDAFAFDGASVDTRNVSRDGSCPAPNLSGGDSSGPSQSKDTTDPQLPKTLTVKGSGRATNYEFTVGGELTRASNADDLEEWDGISGTTATGWVTTSAHVDTYRFSGSVTDFTFLQGEATVYVDGERLDPTDLASETSLPRTVTVTGTGDATEYELSVDGELEANPERGELEQWDNVSGTTATGWVTTSAHVDSYRFSGSVTDFTFHQGSAAVTIDGERVDPSDL